MAPQFSTDNRLLPFMESNLMVSFTKVEIFLPFNQAAPHLRNYNKGRTSKMLAIKIKIILQKVLLIA